MAFASRGATAVGEWNRSVVLVASMPSFCASLSCPFDNGRALPAAAGTVLMTGNAPSVMGPALWTAVQRSVSVVKWTPKTVVFVASRQDRPAHDPAPLLCFRPPPAEFCLREWGGGPGGGEGGAVAPPPPNNNKETLSC